MEKVFDLHFEIGSLACTVVGISPYQTQSADRSYYEHRHHHFELLCVAQGSCTYQCGRETVAMDPGRMLLFPPQHYHKELVSSPDCVRMSLSFQLSRPADSTDRESGLFYEAFARISQPILIEQRELSKKVLSQISDIAGVQRPDLMQRERLKAACHSFLLTLYGLLPAQSSQESGEKPTAPPSIAYVIDNYFALHFSAKGSQEELAAHLHVSPRQLQRLLLRHFTSINKSTPSSSPIRSISPSRSRKFLSRMATPFSCRKRAASGIW
jgi:AraC-like DNA-binding protein